MSTCNRAHACSVQGEQVKDETDERALGYPGWRVVAVCFAMAVVCWGFGFYGHAFYLAELQRLYGWPTSLVSSATTAYYFVSAVLVAFISDAVRRLGARACVLIGSSAFAVSVALLPFIVTPVHLFAVYLLMAVGWATMSVGAITNILGQWFDAKRGLAISLALNGASFSGVVVDTGTRVSRRGRRLRERNARRCSRNSSSDGPAGFQGSGDTSTAATSSTA